MHRLAIAILATTTTLFGAALRSAPARADAGAERLELTMGFMGGQRSYVDTAFTGGGTAAGLRAPFEQPPFDALTVMGLRYDVRLVISHVRMSIGVDVPFASYDPSWAGGTYELEGAPQQVSVTSIQPVALRFGLGGEVTFGPVTPFLDVIGAVQWTSADLSVAGQTRTWDATGFGFATRAGARVAIRDWFFVQASGEVGLVGDVTWSAALSVGFGVD